MSEREVDIQSNDGRRRRRIVAVIPAHDEEEQIGDTVRSLLQQSVRPDRIIVVADNCTDATAAVAAACGGVEVLATVDNHSRKAGALNQAWAVIGATPADDDVLLT